MRVKRFITTVADRFIACNTMTWAASVAFYTALSLAPLLILFIALIANLGVELKATFMQEAEALVGPNAVIAIEGIIENAENRVDLMSWAGILGGITLVLSGSLIFGELRSALSVILGHQEEPEETSMVKSVLKYLKSRVLQMGLAFGFLFSMVASLMVSALITTYIQVENLTFQPLIVITNILLSLAVYIVIFTNIFHFLPMPHLSWRTSLYAGIFTAVLFVIGKELVGFYLGNSGLASAYGAAGSIVILLAWVYYTAVIIFTGAHLAYALRKIVEPTWVHKG